MPYYLDSIKVSEPHYVFALSKIPESKELWGQSERRQRFYEVYSLYTERFNKKPPKELLEVLWDQTYE